MASAASHDQIAANLAALETLLEEFYSPRSSNIRKAEIEAALSNFGLQTDAWRQCLNFILRTNSHFVCMFALGTLENVIQKRWVGLPGNVRSEIRTSLTTFLADHQSSAPVFIRNKLVKLLVFIARCDFPHFYPEFFPNMMQLVRADPASGNVTLGLTMLLNTSEELATPRDDLSASRREELRRLLGQQVPQVLSSLIDLLERCWDCVRTPASTSVVGAASGTTTPPPSPSHHNASFSQAQSQSPGTDSALLHVASHKLLAKTAKPASGPAALNEVVTATLECLTHLFSWIPLSDCVNSNLVAILFKYAAMGISLEAADSVHTQWAISAMSAVNEIMAKNCIPVDFEAYLLELFRNAFQLLQAVVHESEGKILLTSLDEGYVEKLTEFISHFISSHLSRFEGNPSFPVLEFLSLFYKYTFLQSQTEGFSVCLDIWNTFLDHVGATSNGQQPMLAKYHPVLVALAKDLLDRFLLRSNRCHREQFDDTACVTDGKTEWQRYVSTCIESLMKLAEIIPIEVLTTVYAPWKEVCGIYLGLGHHVVNDCKLTICDAEGVKRLELVLGDLCTLQQVIGRVSALFTGEHFLERIQEGTELVKEVIVLAAFSAKRKFYTFRELSTTLANLFVEVFAHTFAALKAWCQWLSQLHVLSLKNNAYEPQCRDFTSRIMMAVAPVVRSQPQGLLLVHSAAHLMVTLTGTVRPPSIWKLKEFTELYSSVHTLTSLRMEDKRLVVRALTNVLMLQWPGQPDQRWDERQKHLTKFLKDLTQDFRQIRTVEDFASNTQLQESLRDTITGTLRLLGDLVENVLDENTQTKKLCFNCLHEYIDLSLWLFPFYTRDFVMCDAFFSFFHVVFDVLKAQMGADSVEHVIQVFLRLFTKEEMTRAIHEEGVGVKAIENFLSILEFVCKEPSKSFRKFIPSTLSLSLEHIFPLVINKPSPDIKGPLYSLLYNVLLHNWKMFFKPAFVRSLDSPSSGGDVLCRTEFLAIMHAFGQSFLQPDITIFRQNLNALEHLNANCKLYKKAIFIDSLTSDFLSVFLTVLVAKSHDLLRDEIVMCVYNMAAVDFPAFFARFLPQFLLQVESLDDSQRAVLATNFKSDADVPSFTSNVNRFITDLRYYKLCNASLPASSVLF